MDIRYISWAGYNLYFTLEDAEYIVNTVGEPDFQTQSGNFNVSSTDMAEVRVSTERIRPILQTSETE